MVLSDFGWMTMLGVFTIALAIACLMSKPGDPT